MEIEFRAWEIKAKHMWELNEIMWTDGKIDQIRLSISAWQKVDKFILMQYTGRKDKKGVKIFADDIVTKLDNNHNPSIYMIEWDNKGYWSAVHCFKGGGQWCSIGLEHYEDCVVIGNVHKDSHLLVDNPERVLVGETD